MANPANYQRSGTEPIRSNQNVKRSDSLNKGLNESGTPTGGRKVSEATTRRSTELNGGLGTSGTKTGGLSTFDATVKSAAWTTSFKGGANAHPAKMDTFNDESV